MKNNTGSFKSYQITRGYGDTDMFYEDIPMSLDRIIYSLETKGKSHSKSDIFRGWHGSHFTSDEIEHIKNSGVFEKYNYEIKEKSLEIGNCLLDITDNIIYCVYRFEVFDLGGNEMVIARKYMGDTGVKMYHGFSSELYALHADMLKFVSDRDLINLGYNFKTNLNDSYITH